MKTLRVVVVSDLHGRLPTIPPCDLLILSGDIAPDFAQAGPVRVYYQLDWFNHQFITWLNSVQCREVVATAGNHDFALFRMRHLLSPDIPWHLLIDEGIELFGLKFWGSPWVGQLPGWAFNLDESQLKRKWGRIPANTDVLVLHSPPFGIGDRNAAGIRCGSTTLEARLRQLTPKLVTFGHIHEGYGEWQRNGATLVNASLLNDQYQPVNLPWVMPALVAREMLDVPKDSL